MRYTEYVNLVKVGDLCEQDGILYKVIDMINVQEERLHISHEGYIVNDVVKRHDYLGGVRWVLRLYTPETIHFPWTRAQETL